MTLKNKFFYSLEILQILNELDLVKAETIAKQDIVFYFGTKRFPASKISSTSPFVLGYKTAKKFAKWPISLIWKICIVQQVHYNKDLPRFCSTFSEII